MTRVGQSALAVTNIVDSAYDVRALLGTFNRCPSLGCAHEKLYCKKHTGRTRCDKHTSSGDYCNIEFLH